jgi:uncharacterized phage protein gp47/JayE
MRTAKEISQQIQTTVRVLDPSVRLDPNTIERKLADAVSEVIAEASIDPYVLNYQYDIDTKAGADLEKFVSLFGFNRTGGRRATGFVRFSRSTPAPTNILIEAGTQVVKPASVVSPSVPFVTTAAVVMVEGTTTIEAPIEAVNSGTLGNVPAGTIIAFGGTGQGQISEVTNENATTNGSLTETDAELRIRFKNTIFRNVAGTQDQFLALAIASRFANKANVVGPVSRFVEFLQIEADGSINSQIPYSKYTYPFDYYLTNGATEGEVFFEPAGVDYTFTANVPPTITVNNSTNLPTGAVVLLEHSYNSANSRNNPASNILNYIDVYVSGQDAITAYEASKFPGTGSNFNSTGSSPYFTGKFLRDGTITPPAVGNRYLPLLWQPVLTAPDSIEINGVTYRRGVDFYLVRDTTTFKGSRRARDGVEFTAAAATSVGTGTEFSINYVFNKLPMTLNELMDRHKQIASDVLVHAATLRFFNVNLIVMYQPGFNKAAVDEAIATALGDFLQKMQFGAILQMSDFLDIVHDVPGVDNIRLALPSDGVSYGVQEVSSNGSPLSAPMTTDFYLTDSDLPVLNSVVATQRSQNTWS